MNSFNQGFFDPGKTAEAEYFTQSFAGRWLRIQRLRDATLKVVDSQALPDVNGRWVVLERCCTNIQRHSAAMISQCTYVALLYCKFASNISLVFVQPDADAKPVCIPSLYSHQKPVCSFSMSYWEGPIQSCGFISKGAMGAFVVAQKSSNVCYFFDIKVIVTTAMAPVQASRYEAWICFGWHDGRNLGGRVQLASMLLTVQYRLEETDLRMDAIRNLRDFQGII